MYKPVSDRPRECHGDEVSIERSISDLSGAPSPDTEQCFDRHCSDLHKKYLTLLLSFGGEARVFGA